MRLKLNPIDGAVLFFVLFAAAVLAHFSYHNLLRHNTLTLEEASPRVFVPRGGRFLSIRGNGFKENIDIRVDGQPPLYATWVNEARIDLQLDGNMEPGPHSVTARNPGGRLVSRQDFFEIMWLPEVNRVLLLSVKPDRSTFKVLGDYFQKHCLVFANGEQVLEVERASPQELQFYYPKSLGGPPYLSELVIKNPGGGETSLRDEELENKMDLSQLPVQPTLLNILPRDLEVGQGNCLAVIGRDLKNGCQIFVGGQQLESLEWLPPFVVIGFIPPDFLFPGEHTVEVVNPGGERAAIELKLLALSKGTAEMQLRIEGIGRDELNGLSASPALHILRVLGSKEEPKEVLVKARLAVQTLPADVGSTALRYYYAGKPLSVGRSIAVPISKERSVTAVVELMPETKGADTR